MSVEGESQWSEREGGGLERASVESATPRHRLGVSSLKLTGISESSSQFGFSSTALAGRAAVPEASS